MFLIVCLSLTFIALFQHYRSIIFLFCLRTPSKFSVFLSHSRFYGEEGRKEGFKLRVFLSLPFPNQNDLFLQIGRWQRRGKERGIRERNGRWEWEYFGGVWAVGGDDARLMLRRPTVILPFQAISFIAPKRRPLGFCCANQPFLPHQFS